MTPVAVGFWLVSALLLYIYLGYPPLVALWARLRPRRVRCASIFPDVSLLIVAHNEEATLSPKLESCLAQDYPADRLRLLVASDGSTDGTDHVVESFAGRGVHLVTFPSRRGKASVLNDVVPSLPGDIVVLSDARQPYAPDAVRRLVEHFADPTVGAVSGNLNLLGEDGTPVGQGLGLYWRYEKWIRRSESLVHSTAGATGAIYAIRRSLFRPIPADTLLDDVRIPLDVVRQGHRVVFAADAIAYDQVSTSRRQEFVRKVRTITGTFQILARERWLWNPIQNPIWFQTLSHKASRLASPVCLVALLALNVALASRSLLYAATLAGQMAFYLAGLTGFFMERIGRRNRLMTACYVFLVLNLATVVSLYRFVTRPPAATWERS